MSVFNEIKHLFTLDNKEFDYDLRELSLLRIYCFLGTILTPTVTALVWENQVTYNLVILGGITLYFVSIFSFSYFNEKVKKNLNDFLFIQYLLVTAYGIFEAYDKSFSADFTLAMTIMIFVFSIALKRIVHIVIYFSFTFSIGVSALLMTDHPETSISYLVSFYLVYFVCGYFVLRNNVKTQDKLRESEHFLKTLFNQSYDAYLLVKSDTRIVVDCNDVALKLFEVEHKHEIVGFKRDKFQLTGMTDEELEACKLELAAAGVWSGLAEYETFKGNRLWVDVAITRLEVVNSMYYVVRLTDITEKHLASEYKEVSENSYRDLFNQGSDLIYIHDKTGEFLDVNDAVVQSTGYSKEELIGQKPAMLAAKDLNDMMAVNSYIEKAWEGTPQKFDWWSRKKNGDHYPKEVVLRKGTYFGKDVIIANGRDLSERYKNEEALFLSEKRYKSLFENNLAGVFRTDMKRTVVDCNDAFVSFMNFKSKEEVIGENVLKLYEGSTDATNYIELLRNKGRLVNHESLVTLKGGKQIWVLENAEIVKFNDEEFIQGTLLDISELKQKSAALEQSEKNMSMVLSAIDEVVYNITIDNNGNKSIEYISPQVERVFGFTQEDYIKLSANLEQYYHPDDLEQLVENMRRIQEAKESVSLVYRFKHLTLNEYRWIEENIFPQFDNNGAHIGNFGIARDINNHMRISGDLQRSEEKYRLLVERMNDGLMYVDNEEKIQFVNNRFCEMTEFSAEELIGKVASQVLLFDNKKGTKVVEGAIKERKKGISGTYEVQVAKKSGEAMWMQISGSPVYNDKNEVIGSVGINQDITIRKQTQFELSQSEERFRNLFELSPIGCALSSPEGNFVQVNQMFVDILGYEKEELYQLSYKDISHPEDVNAGVDLDKKLLAGEIPNFQLEKRYIGKKGNIINALITISLILDDNRKPRFFVGQMSDITERKHVEASLAISEETYREIFDNTTDLLYVQDQHGTFLDVNKAVLDFYNCDKNFIIGKTPEFFADKKSMDLKSALERVKKAWDGEIQMFEFWSLKDGISYPKEMILRRGKYFGKDVVLASAREISERKNYEQQLKTSRERFKNVVENSPDGIIIQINDKAVYANPTALNMLGIAEFEDIIGESIFNYILEDYHKEVKQRLAAVLDGEEQPFMHVKIERMDGKVIDIESKPQIFTYNRMKAILIVLHDISERKQLEKEQLRAELAEDTNKQLQREIEDRIKAELAMEKAQKYTRRIIDSSLDMICATNKDGFITEFNRAAELSFGYKAEEMIGVPAARLYAKDYAQKDVIAQLLQGVGEYSGEILNQRKNGETFTSYLSASVLTDENNKVVGFMGVSRDITDLKLAENELKASEERYRDLFENATDLIQSVNENGDILYVNSAWLNTLGYTEENVKELSIFDVIHPKSQESYQEVLNRVLNGSSIEKVEIEFITKKGKMIVAEGNINTKYIDGQYTATRGIFRDVTVTKEIEKVIKESEERYRALYNQAYIGIAQVSLSGDFLQANQALEEMIGYPSEELKQKTFGEITYKDDREGSIGMLKNFIKKKNERVSFEKRYVHKNGSTIYCSITIALVSDADGEPDYFVTVFDDITERKLAEERLKQSLKEKEVLLKEVHHRVKNNLQVISSILNLQSSYVDDESTLEILRESQDRIKSMSFIHESLYQTKDFASINFSEYVLNLSRNLLHSYQLYGGAIELKHELEEVDLNLDQSIPCGLIINELVSNALKYAFPKGKEGVVTVRLNKKDEYIIFEVCDNGIGLPEKLDIETTDTLGLQLVITLVEQLSGDLVVDRKDGASFIVKFIGQE